MHIRQPHIWQWIGQIIRYHDIPKESHFWIGSHYALLAKANNSLPSEKTIKIRSFSQKCNADFQRNTRYFWWFSNHCALNKYSLMDVYISSIESILFSNLSLYLCCDIPSRTKEGDFRLERRIYESQKSYCIEWNGNDEEIFTIPGNKAKGETTLEVQMNASFAR